MADIFDQAGQQYNVDPNLLRAQMQVESGGVDQAVSSQGAQGPMQLIPATSKALGVSNPFDRGQAVMGAAKLMSQNLDRYGDPATAVMAYHGGTDPANWGPKTQAYLQKVQAAYGGSNMAQSNQMPGLPPTGNSGAPQQMVDPFAGLPGSQNASAASPAAAQSQGLVDPFAGIPDAAKSVPASVAGGTGAAAPQTAVGQSSSALAQDLAAGGASPDTWNQLQQIGSGAAHGVGSMANNAANFVERQAAKIGIFPQTAAADTAAQAASDQEFAQNSSAGQKAAAIVAPLFIPMSGAMRAGNVIKSGIGALPGMGGGVGNMISTLAGNAANGALLSAGAPVDPNQPVAPQDAQHLALGGVLGAGIPAAVGIGRAIGNNIYNAARPILDPRAYVGQGLASALGEAAPDVANSIRSTPQYVVGSVPTTAQASPNPTLVATEKAAANGLPGFKLDLAERENANNQARWDALSAIAQTPQTLNAAVLRRAAAAGPLYDQARAGMYDVDAPLQSLMQRPAMQQALQRGTAIASNEGNTGFVQAVAPIAPTFTNISTGGQGFNGAPLMQQVQTSAGSSGNPAQVSGDVLHYLKMGLDDLQTSAQENTRLGPQEKRAIGDTQGAFMNWLDNAAPAYQEARGIYSQMSPPINTMEAAQQIGQRLSDSGRALNSSGTAQMTAPGYATALAQALRQQQFGIEPVAQQSLENIGRDLQRSTVSNSLRTPGSDTAYNLAASGWLAKQLYGPTFGGAGNVGKAVGALGATALGHPMVGLGILGGGNKIGQMVGGRLNEQLGNLLLNPDALLPYLDARAAGPANATQQALAAALRRNILPAAVGGIARGGLVNAP